MNKVKRISEKYRKNHPEHERVRTWNKHVKEVHKSRGPAKRIATTHKRKFLESRRGIDAVDYETMTVKELRAVAKKLGIKGASKLAKADLVTTIKENQS